MREITEEEKEEYRIPILHMEHYSEVYFPKNIDEAVIALRESNMKIVTIIGRESHSDDEITSFKGMLNYPEDSKGTYELWYSPYGFEQNEKVFAMPLEAKNLEALLVHNS